MDSLTDPESLIDTDGVDVHEVTRSFDDETFDALEARYESIEGVVIVGLTADDGRVLLSTHDGSGGWSPPGGDVEEGEDWMEAARRIIEELTGVAVEIDDPVLLERTTFTRDEGEGSFSAAVVHVGASLADGETAFLDDPRVPEAYEHPVVESDELALGWFDEVPEDAHPNHEEHIALFLE